MTPQVEVDWKVGGGRGGVARGKREGPRGKYGGMIVRSLSMVFTC